MSAPKLTNRSGYTSGDDFTPEQAPEPITIGPDDGWGDPVQAKLAFFAELARWQWAQRHLAEIEVQERRSKGGRKTAAKRTKEEEWVKGYLDAAYDALVAEGVAKPGRARMEKKIWAMFKNDPRIDAIGDKTIRKYLARRR